MTTPRQLDAICRTCAILLSPVLVNKDSKKGLSQHTCSHSGKAESWLKIQLSSRTTHRLHAEETSRNRPYRGNIYEGKRENTMKYVMHRRQSRWFAPAQQCWAIVYVQPCEMPCLKLLSSVSRSNRKPCPLFSELTLVSVSLQQQVISSSPVFQYLTFMLE